MDHLTRKLIKDYSPMWTNKEIWEFEQSNKGLTFDMTYVKPNNFESTESKLTHPNSDIRDAAIGILDEFDKGHELSIASKDQAGLDSKYVAYVMSLMADMMLVDEVCLNFKLVNGCLMVAMDEKADVVDCKEFFEEFYHVAIGFNFDENMGVPEDETEAEIYLRRLQEKFDERMQKMLGDRYIPGNKGHIAMHDHEHDHEHEHEHEHH